jgi:hypothetical protein
MARAETEMNNTRLTIDLPSHMHRMVKAHATLSDVSIKDFIIETIEMRFGEEKTAKKDRISKNQMNAKTIAVIEDSIKNHAKLKSFNSAEEAMADLLAPSKRKKKSAKKKLKK